MVSSAAGRSTRSGLWFSIVLVAALAMAAFAVLLHHHSRGRIALTIEHRLLPVASMHADTGHCRVASLGVDWLSGHARPSPARLLEDGRDLGPANAMHDVIRSKGGGAYSVWHGQVYFSSSDGSDPLTNGRRYEIVWPTPIATAWRHGSTVLAVLLAAAAVWLGRRRRLHPLHWLAASTSPRVTSALAFLTATEGRRAWRTAAFVALVAIVARAVAYVLVQNDLAGNISGALVMGVPFSDAQGWDNQGDSIMGGHGLVGMWSARRPFYAFVLGVLYTWTGPSAFAVSVCHMFVGGLTAALVCRIGQLTVSPIVGLVGGIAFAFDPVSIEYSGFLLTETVGTFLFVVAVHQLVISLRYNRAASAWWGGVAFVLSNLTRTLTLPAAPLLAGILFWRGRADGRGWRRGAWLALLFSLGFALPLGAWIVRQKAVHDLTTISDNTASGLYAAASPKYGTWSSYVDREAEEAGVPKEIKPRYDWFMERFRAELAADPWFYVQNVADSAVEAMRGLGDTTHLTRALLVVLLLGIWLSRLRALENAPARLGVWTLSSAAGVVAVCSIEGLLAAALGLAGLVVACAMQRDRAMSIAVAGFLGTVGAVALFALGSDHRLLLMVSWLHPLGLGTLVVVGMNAIAGRIAAAGLEPTSVGPAVLWSPRWQSFALAGFLVFVAANFGWLVYRNFASPAAMLPPLPLPTIAAAQDLVGRLAELQPQLIRAEELRSESWYQHTPTVAEQVAHHGEFIVASARLSRHRYPIAAETRVSHWSRMFAVRPYDRTFTYAETYLPDGSRGPACILLTAPLPPANVRDVVVLGRVNVDPAFVIEECYLEVLGWVPIDLDGSFDLADLQVVSEPRHAVLVNSLRD